MDALPLSAFRASSREGSTKPQGCSTYRRPRPTGYMVSAGKSGKRASRGDLRFKDNAHETSLLGFTKCNFDRKHIPQMLERADPGRSTISSFRFRTFTMKTVLRLLLEKHGSTCVGLGARRRHQTNQHQRLLHVEAHKMQTLVLLC